MPSGGSYVYVPISHVPNAPQLPTAAGTSRPSQKEYELRKGDTRSRSVLSTDVRRRRLARAGDRGALVLRCSYGGMHVCHRRVGATAGPERNQ